jgi:hypothetical protein
MMHSLLIFTKTNQYLEVNYVWIFTLPAKKKSVNCCIHVIRQLLTFVMVNNINICQSKRSYIYRGSWIDRSLY